jgi:hypothetical protein
LYKLTAPFEVANQESYFKIFLAGGISNCHDWQTTAEQFLSVHLDDRFLSVNPRREAFDLADPTASSIQIKWEHHHLQTSDMVMFWFPHETLCPITLFELGVMCRNKHIVVGVDDEYKRRFDVIKQMSLYRPRLEVQTSLQATLNKVVQEAKAYTA